MRETSFCSLWTGGDTNNQSLAGSNDVTVALNKGNGFSNNTISVTNASCNGGFHFGTIDLGSKNYVNGGGATFMGNGTTSTKSTITWNATTRTLVITLGTRSGSNVKNVANSAPTYTSDPGITDSAGAAIGNSPFQLPAGTQF